MYSQQEASLLRQRFWISFGKYMSPIPSSNREKANWINYRTGIKAIQFKMDAGSDEVMIAIEISHQDAAVCELYFNHFKTFKNALEEISEAKWKWEPGLIYKNGINTHSISAKFPAVNIYKEEDWPQIISFLKTRLIGLDKFWNEYKDIFEMLS